MKYLKILLLLMTFSSVSNADYLLDSKNICILDFYTKGNKFYYLKSKDEQWYSTTTKNYGSSVLIGYSYWNDVDECHPKDWLILGMDVKDFNFLMALIGVIFGGIFMFFTVEAFTKVGGKR